MNKRQIAVAERLEKALVAMGEVGLNGGVFDGTFCLWPENTDMDIDKNPGDFFDNVEKYGLTLSTHGVYLDGGAGV